jgi:hypothetical protein
LGRIGVLTTSGKAYHALVSELSRKGLEYVSLLPGQSVPLDVRVIVTTDRSESTIQGRSVLAFEEGSDPREAVEESILLLLGKVRFRSLVLGIDPGKQTGLAVLGDGLILETGSYTEAKDLVEDVAHILSAFPSERSVVKIGRGAEEYSRALRSILGSRLSPVVEIQMVEEAGTTTDSLSPEDEGMSRNIVSAIRIALRQGEKMGRRGRCPSP